MNISGASWCNVGLLTIVAASVGCGSATDGTGKRNDESTRASSSDLIIEDWCVLDPVLCPPKATGKVQWALLYPNASGMSQGANSVSFYPMQSFSPATDLFVGDFGANGAIPRADDYMASNGGDGIDYDYFAYLSGTTADSLVAVDDARNVYMAFNASGQAQFGGDNVPGVFIGPPVNVENIVVSKWSSAFSYRTFASANGAKVRAMTVNPAGGVVLVGGYTGAPTFGSIQLDSAPGGASFVLELDSNLNVTAAFDSGGQAGDEALAVAFDPSGDLLLAGTTSATPTLFTCPLVPLTAGTGTLGYVASIQPGGKLAEGCNWAKSASSQEQTSFRSVAADPAGGVVLGGDFRGTIDFGPGMVWASGAEQPLVVSLDQSGKLRWARAYSATGGGYAVVAVDPWSEIAVGGAFQGAMNLGTGSISGNPWSGFVTKLNASGTSMWNMTYQAGDEPCGVEAVAVDGAGNIGVAGTFQGVTTVGTTSSNSGAAIGMLMFDLTP